MKKLIKIKLDEKIKTDDGQSITLSEGSNQEANAGQVAYDCLMYPAPALLRKMSGAEKKRWYQLALKIKAGQPFVELDSAQVAEVQLAAWEKYTPLVAGAFENVFVEWAPPALEKAAEPCEDIAEAQPSN